MQIDPSALPTSAQVQLVDLSFQADAVETLGAPAPSYGLATTPAATVDLSPEAQSLLDGSVSSMEVSQIEQSVGIDPSAPSTAAPSGSAAPSSTAPAGSFDPADPFGTGLIADNGVTSIDDALLSAQSTVDNALAGL